jgi:hypothetical protein
VAVALSIAARGARPILVLHMGMRQVAAINRD